MLALRPVWRIRDYDGVLLSLRRHATPRVQQNDGIPPRAQATNPISHAETCGFHEDASLDPGQTLRQHKLSYLHLIKSSKNTAIYHLSTLMEHVDKRFSLAHATPKWRVPIAISWLLNAISSMTILLETVRNAKEKRFRMSLQQTNCWNIALVDSF